MIPRSIRSRILLGITLPAILILVVSSVALNLWIRAESLEQLDRALETRAAAMAALIELEGGVWDVDFDSENVPVTALFGPLAAYEVRVVDGGDLLARRSFAGLASDISFQEPHPDIALDELSLDRPFRVVGKASTVTAEEGPALRSWSGVFIVRAHGGDEDVQPKLAARPADSTLNPAVRIVVSQDLSPLSEELRELLRAQVAVGIALSGLAVIFGWLLSRRIVDPIEAMADRAEGVHAPSPEPPLPLSGTGDEIDRLAEALNRSFGRLHQAYVFQSRFTSDASHELRTPLTVIHSQAEVALRHPRTEEEYREALAAVVSGSERMNEILEALLLLARNDENAVESLPNTVDVGALASGIVLEMAADARPGLAIRFEGPATVLLLGDARHLELALRNVLSNAIRHTPPPGDVVLRLVAAADHILVEVEDTGEGISAEALPHIFERFFRADQARTRNRGGSGLGLSLVKAVVEQHSGSVHVTSKLGEGTTVRLRLPRAEPGVLAEAASA